MKNKFLLLFILFSCDQYETPRTIYGAPDLQGVWSNNTLTTLERPPQIKNLILSSDEAQKHIELLDQLKYDYENSIPKDEAPPKGEHVQSYNTVFQDPSQKLLQIDGKYRSSIITNTKNGRLPYRTDFLKQMINLRDRFLKYADRHPEERLLAERCIIGFGSSGGPPMLNEIYNNYYQIIQSPGYVTILVEMVHDARIIPIEGEHLPETLRPWLGSSVGRWEGDTLVITTKNFHSSQMFRVSMRHVLAVSPKAIVEERLKRISDNEILYQFSVNDLEPYTKVWQGEMIFHKQKGIILEYACHEENQDLEIQLKAGRKREKESS